MNSHSSWCLYVSATEKDPKEIKTLEVMPFAKIFELCGGAVRMVKSILKNKKKR